MKQEIKKKKKKKTQKKKKKMQDRILADLAVVEAELGGLGPCATLQTEISKSPVNPPIKPAIVSTLRHLLSLAILLSLSFFSTSSTTTFSSFSFSPFSLALRGSLSALFHGVNDLKTRVFLVGLGGVCCRDWAGLFEMLLFSGCLAVAGGLGAWGGRDEDRFWGVNAAFFWPAAMRGCAVAAVLSLLRAMQLATGVPSGPVLLLAGEAALAAVRGLVEVMRARNRVLAFQGWCGSPLTAAHVAALSAAALACDAAYFLACLVPLAVFLAVAYLALARGAPALPGDGGHPDVVALDTGTWPADGGGVSMCREALLAGLPLLRWAVVAEVSTTGKAARWLSGGRRPASKPPVCGVVFQPAWDPEPVCTARLARDPEALALMAEVAESLAPLAASGGGEVSAREMARVAALLASSVARTTLTWAELWSTDMVALWRRAVLARDPRAHLYDVDECRVLLAHSLSCLDWRGPAGRMLSAPTRPVIHASHHGTQALAGVAARALHGSRLVVWDHGIMYRERLIALFWGSSQASMRPQVRSFWASLARVTAVTVLSHADEVVSVCQGTNQAWERRLITQDKAPTLSVVPNYCFHAAATTTTTQHPATASSARNTVISIDRLSVVAMLSAVVPIKGILAAIEAMTLLPPDLSHLRLVIFGSLEVDRAYVERCRQAIRASGMDIVLAGHTATPIASLLEVGAQAVLLTSLSEALPGALLDAAACSIPAIATAVGAVPELLGPDGDDCSGGGYLAEPSNPASVAAAVVAMARLTHEQRQTMGQRWKERVAKVYNRDLFLRGHARAIKT
jgi:glycosyltransferase involved in cell wall biosynthesis